MIELMRGQGRGRARNRIFGFTLIEALIGCLITFFVVLSLNRLLSGSQRSTQHNQETTAHLLAEITLFQFIEADLKGMLPWAVKTTSGNLGTPAAFSPTEMLFSSLLNGKLKRIRYSYDSSREAVIRTEEDSSGGILRQTPVGLGLVKNFQIEELAPEARILKITLIMKGKLRSTSNVRFFSRGRLDRKDSQFWQYNVQ